MKSLSKFCKIVPVFIVLASSTIARAETQALVTIARTQLRVALPEGWRIDPAADGIQSAQLRHTTLQGLEIKCSTARRHNAAEPAWRCSTECRR
jgi:hypothetical protein